MEQEVIFLKNGANVKRRTSQASEGEALGRRVEEGKGIVEEER
jgi:hypothetical protein